LDLHLTDADWLDMTPRMLHALRKKQLEQMQREELLVGILAATSANFSFCRPERPMRPESFMLHPFKADALTQPSEHRVTGEDIMAAFAHIPKRRRIA
jgi:hypothetical protein